MRVSYVLLSFFFLLLVFGVDFDSHQNTETVGILHMPLFSFIRFLASFNQPLIQFQSCQPISFVWFWNPFPLNKVLELVSNWTTQPALSKRGFFCLCRWEFSAKDTGGKLHQGYLNISFFAFQTDPEEDPARWVRCTYARWYQRWTR